MQSWPRLTCPASSKFAKPGRVLYFVFHFHFFNRMLAEGKCLKTDWTSFDWVCLKQHYVRCLWQAKFNTTVVHEHWAGMLYVFFTAYICFTVIGFRLAERNQHYQPTKYSGILHKYDSAVIEKYGAQIWRVQTNLMLPSHRFLAQVTWQQQVFQAFLWERKVQPFAASIMLLVCL